MPWVRRVWLVMSTGASTSIDETMYPITSFVAVFSALQQVSFLEDVSVCSVDRCFGPFV